MVIAGPKLVAEVAAMMERHWRADLGWSVPNPDVYPWLWSWDSCFHALVWDALGDERAVTELSGVFAAQTPSGFVPHINYAADPDASVSFWGVRGASTLTQPPMYGHALAVLGRHGRDIAPLLAPATRGLRRLLEARRAPCGLLRIYHPWESGIDDHPRWAPWQPDPWDREAWRPIKFAMVEALTVDAGEAVGSRGFDTCPVSFNALVAWNAMELAGVTGDDRLLDQALELAAVVDRRWDADRVTWCDAAPDGTPRSAVRTLDALLPALVTSHPRRVGAALGAVLGPGGFTSQGGTAHGGLPFGPAGVHPDEPAFAPDSYGRGSAWPHLTYLLWVLARRSGYALEAAELARRLNDGARRSGLAEYWDPRDGTGLGARPQGWSGLAIVAGPPTDPGPAGT